jgi:hypothetical protein
MPLNKRKARVLTRLKISEISAVDKGAGEGCYIMLKKRASDAAFGKATRCLAMSVKSIAEDSNCDKNAMLTKTFAQFQDHLNTLMQRHRKNLDVAVDEADDDEGMPDDANSRRARGDDDDEPSDNDGADPNGAPTKHLERLRDAMKGTDINPLKKLKSLDAIAVCKQMVSEEHAFGLSEHDLVSLVDTYARAHDSSFVKMFTAQDDTGLALRKAVDIAKNAQFVSKLGGSTPHYLADGSVPTMSPGKATLKPRSSGFSGKPAQQGVNNPRLSIAQLQALIDAQRAEADDDEAGEGGQHYEKLLKLAEDAHAAEPEKSVAQHFEKIYTSREHRELAMAERKANRPTAAW